MRIEVADDALAAAALAADWIARRLRLGVRSRGRAALALSGGSTPLPLYDALVVAEVPWHAVDLFQVDERVVGADDPSRNARALRRRLVEPAGLPADRVHLMPVEAPGREGAAEYAALVAGHSPLDVVHLGFGDDGHTASWPPGDPVVDAEHPVAMTAEFNGHARMTLTPGPVNGARSRIVVVSGVGKAPIVERFLLGDASIPASRVRRANTLLMLDADAASRLPAPGAGAR